MAGTGPLDLDALAHDLLDAAVLALDTIPTFAPGLAGAPERSFVSSGQPAFDCCPQLTVHVGPIEENAPYPYPQAARFGARKNRLGLILNLTRCVTLVGEPPQTGPLEDDAAQTNADAWALWNDLWNQVRSGDLFTLCDETRPTLRPLQPSGGCTGWTQVYVVALEGYEST